MATTNIVIRNVLKTTQVYGDFVSNPVAFVFQGFTGLENINGIAVGDISVIPHIGNRVKFETVSTYTSGTEWTIPNNYLGKFVEGSYTFYVVFGFIDSSGYRLTTVGTCGNDITLTVNVATVPVKLYNCKVDALPIRLDCLPGDATTIFNLVGQPAGEVLIS